VTTGVAAGLRVEIRPSRGLPGLDVRELWAYRDLLFFLVMRDLKVRYRQTVLGAAWAILQPVLTMVVFSVFFGRLARVPSDSLPYPVFALAALLPWQLFANTLAQSASSVVSNSTLVTRVYFPRILIPIAAVATGLVDFAIAFGVLVLMMGYYGIRPTLLVVTLPAFLALALATALAVGLWLAVLNVRYRDVRYTIPFLTQLWLFLSPVAYPSSIVPRPWSLLYALNPMAGVVEGFRWALLGHTGAPGPALLVSAAAVLALLAGGFVYFRTSERTFADVV
jgi:lipopolysaccharide transport system permease protein